MAASRQPPIPGPPEDLGEGPEVDAGAAIRVRRPRSSPPRRALRAVRDSLADARRAGADWLFNQPIYARVRRREHVLCLGDSHVAVMEHVSLREAWFRTRPVIGATASGVLNPASSTSAMTKFGARLDRARPFQQVLLLLGEVDCGFVIWHRARRRNLSIEEQLHFTIDSYSAFIERVIAMGFRRVIVLSAPLPTIGDEESLWGEVASMRKAVTASQRERTDLTLRFNDALAERASALGAIFVDVTTGHLEPDTGLVDPRFLRETHHDHHLAERPYADLIAHELAGRLR